VHNILSYAYVHFLVLIYLIGGSLRVVQKKVLSRKFRFSK
jgi:hypothetical protein